MHLQLKKYMTRMPAALVSMPEQCHQLSIY